MLLSFGARNFLSFKEGVEVSFELNNNCPDHISSFNGASTTLCLKGANASGKTNIIKLIFFIKDFCCDSWDQKPEDKIPLFSFFHNDEPIEVFCKFINEKGETIVYELVATPDGVEKETISIVKKNKEIPILSRIQDRLECAPGYEEVSNIKLRSNASMISTGHQYVIESIDSFYNFFRGININSNNAGFFEFAHDRFGISKFYNQHENILKKTIEFLRRIDTGIKDIKIVERETENGENEYLPLFIHNVKGSTEDPSLTYLQQSAGTQALFRYLPYYFISLDTGGVLVVDEFERDLHSDILPLIIEFFNSEETNPKHAQLLFSTHDNETLDILGKYRTFLVNKKDSESFGYRLDEMGLSSLRNDRPISPFYKSGKVGGVPTIL